MKGGLQAKCGILERVAQYYDGRAREFGATPWGVDWTCEPTQQLRFVQLLKIAGRKRRFSVNDVGCGYGALLPFVRERFGAKVDYAGIDVAGEMIARATELHGGQGRFLVSGTAPRMADFSVASGIFNVHLGHSRAAWTAYVRSVLSEMHRASRIGFAVNFIVPARPGQVPLEGLYRTRPAPWAGFCRREFDAAVEVLEGYGLREFTLLVRRAKTS